SPAALVRRRHDDARRPRAPRDHRGVADGRRPRRGVPAPVLLRAPRARVRAPDPRARARGDPRRRRRPRARRPALGRGVPPAPRPGRAGDPRVPRRARRQPVRRRRPTLRLPAARRADVPTSRRADLSPRRPPAGPTSRHTAAAPWAALLANVGAIPRHAERALAQARGAPVGARAEGRNRPPPGALARRARRAPWRDARRHRPPDLEDRWTSHVSAPCPARPPDRTAPGVAASRVPPSPRSPRPPRRSR